MTSGTIRKTVILHATRERVWRAISDPVEFGRWFGVALNGPFVPGAQTHGHIVPTEVDPDVAQLQEPHRGTPFRILVDRIEPMRLFAFRWHPFAVERDRDYSAETMTLVTFELEDAPEGMRLTITEAGFEALPPDRRAAAFAANQGGWSHQARLIARYVEAA